VTVIHRLSDYLSDVCYSLLSSVVAIVCSFYLFIFDSTLVSQRVVALTVSWLWICSVIFCSVTKMCHCAFKSCV